MKGCVCDWCHMTLNLRHVSVRVAFPQERRIGHKLLLGGQKERKKESKREKERKKETTYSIVHAGSGLPLCSKEEISIHRVSTWQWLSAKTFPADWENKLLSVLSRFWSNDLGRFWNHVSLVILAIPNLQIQYARSIYRYAVIIYKLYGLCYLIKA